VAFVVSVPRDPLEDDNGAPWAELHVVDAKGGAPRPFVTGEVNVSGVAWRPDGAAITFLAKRGDDKSTALYEIPLAGGEARRVLAMVGDISSFAWSPDGATVAVVAGEPEPEDIKKLRDKGFNQVVYEEDWRHDFLWLARPSGEGEPRRIVLPGSAVAVRWSPGGERLAVAVTPRPLTDDHYMFQRIHVVDVASGKVSARIDNPGKLGDFAWSPDGQQIAMISGTDIHDDDAGSLLVAEAAGGVPRNATAGFAGKVEALTWRDSQELVALVSEGTRCALYTVREPGVMGRLGWALTGPVFSSMRVSPRGQKAVFLGETSAYPREVFAGDLSGEAPARLTTTNPWLADVDLGRQEVVSYAARDGLSLEGLLIRPTGEAKAPWPLVVVVHGGPEAHYSDGWLTSYGSPGQVLAGRGFAVFYPNYRGSTGRGVAFSMASFDDPAGKEFDDIVDGADHLIKAGLVDTERVGVTGGSYGGYATAWMATRYSERFAAGVMFVGITNLISKAGGCDIPQEDYLVHIPRRAWEEHAFLWERSPLAHAAKGRTPLLILHGKEDPRVPAGQSMELYRALKTIGRAPVRLVLYPGEGHGNRKAAARYDASLRIVQWFEHYLLGPGGDPPPQRIEYP
jgi:dipeptidyl aminopeptidase/acylaminoacyl peptidase